jgi:hypothetical protein
MGRRETRSQLRTDLTPCSKARRSKHHRSIGVFFSSDATPMNLLIDARTMRIVDKLLGYNPTTHWQTIDYYVDQL